MESNQRKLETRTKIQLGGLILKSGLAQSLGITPGDDLQQDVNKRDAAYALLGILYDTAQSLPGSERLTSYISKGKHLVN